MSAKSFASTLIETPALHQNMMSFPQMLEVNIEDEEGEARPSGIDGYAPPDGGRFENKQRGGKSYAASSSATGNSVSEIQRRYENTTQEIGVRGNQQSLETMRGPSLKKSLHAPTLAAKADAFEISRTSANPPEQQISNDITSLGSNAKQELKEGLQGLGLGLPYLNHSSDTGESWQADMKRLEMSISDAVSIGTSDMLSKGVSTGSRTQLWQVSDLQTQLTPSSSSFSDLTEKPNRKNVLTETSTNEQRLGTKSPKLLSRVSSSRARENGSLAMLSRTGSPFRETSQTPISPSQSILNLSQKGLASERRKLWEASSIGGGLGHTPLRLHKRLESNAKSSNTILGESSGKERHFDGVIDDSSKDSSASHNVTAMPPFHNYAVNADSRQPAYVGDQTSRQHNGVEAPSLKLFKAGALRADLPPEPLVSSRSFGHMSSRQPVPLLMASVSEGFQKSPTCISSSKHSLTTLPVSAEPTAAGGTTESVHQMERTLYDGALSFAPATKTLDSNERGEVKDITNVSQESLYRDPMQARSDNATNRSSVTLDSTSNRQPRIFKWTASSASADLGPNSEPTAVNSSFHPASKLEAESNRHGREHGSSDTNNSYRCSQSKDLPAIRKAASQDDQPDTSYFNYRTGVDLSAASLPDHSAQFSLAKTYTDWATPISTGLYAIPMSPDMNGGGSAPSAGHRLYSKSPLTKSPGKRFVGKLVDVAKKAVPAGVKHGAGNLNRFMHNDRVSFGGSNFKDHHTSKFSPAISQAPSIVERREAQDMQPHWGNELHGMAMSSVEMINASEADQDLRYAATPKERELPPIPQGQVMHIDVSTADAGSVHEARLWTQQELSSQPEEGCEADDTVFTNAEGPAERASHVEQQRADLSPILEFGEGPQELLQPNRATIGQGNSAENERAEFLKDVHSVQDERGLSVFRTRQAMMRQPGRLTTPAPLSGVEPTCVDVLSSSKVTPPVTMAFLQSPMDMANQGPPREMEPLRLPRRIQQTTPTLENGFGQEGRDTSPTKTERLRTVADWAQGAAIAPPPPANDPRNASQEAALYRDEDRLDIRIESPAMDFASLPTAHVASRALPSTPAHIPWKSHSRMVSDDAEHIFENRLPEADVPVTQAGFCRPSPADGVRDSEVKVLSPNDLALMESRDPRPLLVLTKAVSPTPFPNEEVDAHVAMPLDVVSQLNEIRAGIQALQQATDATQVDGTFKEALMLNKDQTGEILAKTDIVLNTMTSIQEKFEGFPEAAYLAVEEQAATREGHNGMLRTEQNLETSSETANDALSEQLNDWAHGMQQQISNDVLGLQQNVGGVLQVTGALHEQSAFLQRELGIRSPGAGDPEGGMQSLDLRSRLDYLTGMLSDILATSDTQGVVAGRMDRVIEALGVIQSKPDPLPPISKFS
ncbi:hypothetical protein QFC22_000155 [Naganishia vaughanmartiniae]|uniref:Uncharacterized protein n=1 Tax=Naganishia vaughanmartiniae TaxID=1424756 RepID=A0ACC2XQA4_9TREE|nr:hypothetical protein QFC22_000155 [Naganishia vaughanmartiniae]